MLIKTRKLWELPGLRETPERVAFNRRHLIVAAGGVAAASILPTGVARAATDPTADLYPAKSNGAYTLDRALTPEAINVKYNNYYEFGSSKQISDAADVLPTRPWTLKIDGMVEQPLELAIDDLVRKLPLEERLYRHRCVEAWSMTIPWTGFPLAKLVALARPLGSAKYLRFETFSNPDVAHGQQQEWYPWPYTEGLTIEEAGNDLALLVTGAYGKPLSNSFGAPLRLHLPWKYGFKSIKAITRISFTDQQPPTFWNTIAANEYGFWANVNPEVPHPRWSQAQERVLGTEDVVPTLLFNGYGAAVAQLYQGKEAEPLYM